MKSYKLIVVIDYSKTNFKCIENTKKDLIEKEVYSMIVINETKLKQIKRKFPNLKHVRELGSKKRINYLIKFSENFDTQFFECVVCSLSLEELLLIFKNKLYNKNIKILVLDDHVFKKSNKYFKNKEKKIKIIKEGNVRDPKLKNLCLIADGLANLYRRRKEIFRDKEKIKKLENKISKV